MVKDEVIHFIDVACGLIPPDDGQEIELPLSPLDIAGWCLLSSPPPTPRHQEFLKTSSYAQRTTNIIQYELISDSSGLLTNKSISFISLVLFYWFMTFQFSKTFINDLVIQSTPRWRFSLFLVFVPIKSLPFLRILRACTTNYRTVLYNSLSIFDQILTYSQVSQ